MHCSIARAMDVLGDVWAALVLRDVALGIHRFDEIHRDLGIASNTLTDRLSRLVKGGLLARIAYQKTPVRYEYRLTERGKAIFPVLLALLRYGDQLSRERDGLPMVVHHHGCGDRPSIPMVTCHRCGLPLTLDGVTMRAGPGSRATRGTALLSGLLKAR